MMRLLRRLIPDRHPIRLVWHYAKALLAAVRHGFPARKLTVIGVTGTDGKTTTISMIAHILRTYDLGVAIASTAFLQINDEKTTKKSHLTSIPPSSLQAFLRKAVEKKCSYAVIEMSSHSLVQGRNHYTWPSVSAITNTSLEHLDYHGSMEQYRKDKGIIFKMLRDKGTKILNCADESFHGYLGIPSTRTILFNPGDGSDLWTEDMQATASGCTAVVHTKDGKAHQLTLSIPGIFNIENALCAIACAHTAGINVEESIAALESFTGIPGRLERIDEGQDFSAFVDFSVSPQSYEKTLTTLRQIAGEDKRVLVLCSSCGNRMKEKRPEIGMVCSELADVVVACEDETYGEDPHKVLDEVWAGINQNTCEAHKIFDRREAMKFLLQKAKKGDAVVCCGMGPFTTMNKLEGEVQWDERQVMRELLHELTHA